TVEGQTLTEPNFIRYVTGVRRKQWHKNCVAVGLSGGFMEPLESTSIHLIQRAVLRLIRMLPGGRISRRDVAEFNEQQFADMEQIRDFLILHYKVTERRDSPFWRQCASMAVPESLEQKIELFRETGRVFRKNEELFAENSWIQVMLGQGIMPQAYHPVAGKLRQEELDHFLGSLRETVSKTVAGLPSHRDYIASYCAAADDKVAA
ncbi:MAG: tryptophan 7-halogenase, partial [Novosphingobium sp.]